MILDQVGKELRSALNQLRAEHAQLSSHISQVERMLAQMGEPVRRGPGRPKGSGTKRRGPGRPKGSGTKVAPAVAAQPAKRGPGRPKGSGKKAAPAAASKASGGGAARRKPKWSAEARAQARERMKAYWASRKAGGSGGNS
jgi:hypothetical protein